MDEKFTRDLSFVFNSSAISSSKNEYEAKGVANFNHNGDSHRDIKGSFKQIIQSDFRSVHIENKEDGEGFEADSEDLLLYIEDEESNFDEYELSEEQENYLLSEDCPEHYIQRGGMILWNDDEYEFTEEQENYLLSEDCTEHYINSLGISNLSKVYTTDDEDKLLFVDMPPSSVNQNTVCVQEARNSDVTRSSNRNSSDGKKHTNLSISADTENEIIRDLLNMSTQPIKSKDLRYNSEIRSDIPSYFNDTMTKQDAATKSDDEAIAEIDIISDIENEEEFFMNDGDENNSQSLYNDIFTEPTEISIPQNNCLSSKIIPIISSKSENDKVHSSEDSSTDERVRDREFDVSKVMKSDSARRAYLNLLKEKTHSLLRSYSKYKSDFLQSPLRFLEELELNKSFSEEENVPAELFNDPKKIRFKLLNKNIDVSPLKNKPLNIAVENTDVQSASQFINHAENKVERVRKRLIFSKRNTGESDLRQPHDRQEIQGQTREQIIPEPDDKCIKDIGDKRTFDASLEEKTFCSIGGVVLNIPKEVVSYGVTEVLESRHSNISRAFSKETQQNVKIENLCALQNFNMKDLSDPETCFMPDQFSMTKEDISSPEINILNKLPRKFPGSKNTEILGSHMFVGYEAMDFQSTNNDSDIVSDVDDVDVTHSKFKFQKERRNDKMRTPTLKHSKRTSDVRHTDSNSQTLRRKRSKINFNPQTLLDLFSLDNKIVTSILLALLSDRYKTGAFLTDIMKYLRREMTLETASKLRQDIEKFLKAAVEADIIQMKYGRYVLTREKEKHVISKTLRKAQNKDKNKSTTSMGLRKRQKTNK